jgi:hypothetical protein
MAPRTAIIVFDITPDDVHVKGTPDDPYLNIGGTSFYAETFTELEHIGAEIMRQARMRQAEANQARAVRLGSPVLGTVEP